MFKWLKSLFTGEPEETTKKRSPVRNPVSTPSGHATQYVYRSSQETDSRTYSSPYSGHYSAGNNLINHYNTSTAYAAPTSSPSTRTRYESPSNPLSPALVRQDERGLDRRRKLRTSPPSSKPQERFSTTNFSKSADPVVQSRKEHISKYSKPDESVSVSDRKPKPNLKSSILVESGDRKEYREKEVARRTSPKSVPPVLPSTPKVSFLDTPRVPKLKKTSPELESTTKKRNEYSLDREIPITKTSLNSDFLKRKEYFSSFDDVISNRKNKLKVSVESVAPLSSNLKLKEYSSRNREKEATTKDFSKSVDSVLSSRKEVSSNRELIMTKTSAKFTDSADLARKEYFAKLEASLLDHKSANPPSNSNQKSIKAASSSLSSTSSHPCDPKPKFPTTRATKSTAIESAKRINVLPTLNETSSSAHSSSSESASRSTPIQAPTTTFSDAYAARARQSDTHNSAAYKSNFKGNSHGKQSVTETKIDNDLHHVREKGIGKRYGERRRLHVPMAELLEPDTFVLPESTLSLEEYYKAYNYEQDSKGFIVPKAEIGDKEKDELAHDIYKSSATDEKDIAKTNWKVLTPEYEHLLNAARCGKKSVTRQLLERPEFARIHNSMLGRFYNVAEATKKFTIFVHLMLTQEFLEADVPLAQGVCITVPKFLRGDESTNKCIERSKGKDRIAKRMLELRIPSDKRFPLEEKVSLHTQIHLIMDDDVTEQNGDATVSSVLVVDIKPPRFKNDLLILKFTASEKNYALLKAAAEENTKFSIFLLPNFCTFRYWFAAAKAMKQKYLAAKVFPKSNTEPNLGLYLNERETKMAGLFAGTGSKFNEAQRHAIFAMTRRVHSTFILFGPPGTGKTTTLVETVRQLCQCDPQRRVLVCTPSNMAADAFAEALVDSKLLPTKDVFRLMSSSQDAFARNHKLSFITKVVPLKDFDGNELRPVYEMPDDISKFRVVICTLGSTPRLSNHVDAGHFSHIIVDEAAQASEMETWLPIGLLANDQTRLILAGDPKQLGPVTTTDALNRPVYGFKTSLLMRLSTDRFFTVDPRHMVQLVENYRSHESIVKFASDQFYESSLVATKPKGHDSLAKAKFLPKTDFPVVFHSVEFGAEAVSDKKSKSNEAEVEIVLQYIEKVRACGVADKDIGVVSPYKYQAEKIRTRLKKSDVTVETVERFQGSERRVIIMTTVRTSGNLGFLADDLRLNTSLTRAKHLLIVIGNRKSLCTHATWKKFIDYCRKNGSIVESLESQMASMKVK